MNNRFNIMEKRFDQVDDRLVRIEYKVESIEDKLVGIGNQFELPSESRISDIGFVMDKMNKLEKEIYLLRQKDN